MSAEQARDEEKKTDEPESSSLSAIYAPIDQSVFEMDDREAEERKKRRQAEAERKARAERRVAMTLAIIGGALVLAVVVWIMIATTRGS